jgi:glycosyltransferase involved in cell wall biosynthesis
MRIVHVINSHQENMAGPESHVILLAVAQKDRGSSVTAVTDQEGPFASSCRQHGIPVVITDGLRPGPGRAGEYSSVASRGLAADFWGANAEVIHLHSIPAAMATMPAVNEISIPCVITSNSSAPLAAARKAGLRFVTICTVKSRQEHLRKADLPEDEVFYIPLGTRAVLPGRPSARHRPPRPRLVSAGNLTAREGMGNAIVAMVELRRRLGRDCPTLTIYGEGPLKPYLAEMTTVCGMEDLIGFCESRSRVFENVTSADILVMTSCSEAGFHLVLEAMSRGMPAVAPAVGAVTGMVPDQRYGRLVPPDSIVAIARALESLLSDIASGRFDPDLLIDRHRSLYTDEKMAEYIQAVYKRAAMIGSAPA